ncbi:MAG: hypothetical protein ACRDKI_04625 [Solirubrobacterales bacterium]
MTTSKPQVARNGLPLLLPAERQLPDGDKNQIENIRGAIHEAGLSFRERHRWIVSHQDVIGLSIFLAAIAAFAAMTAAYLVGVVPWWASRSTRFACRSCTN